jgi:hypothetical protein
MAARVAMLWACPSPVIAVSLVRDCRTVGGDKRSQTKDIERAKAYWSNYLKENEHGKAK